MRTPNPPRETGKSSFSTFFSCKDFVKIFYNFTMMGDGIYKNTFSFALLSHICNFGLRPKLLSLGKTQKTSGFFCFSLAYL